MKRITSLLLAMALLVALAATPTLAEHLANEQPLPEAVEQLAADIAESVDATVSEEESGEDGEIAPEATETDSAELSETVTQNENAAPLLRFDELRKTIEKNNDMAKALNSQLSSIDNMDISSMDAMAEEIQTLGGSLSSAKKTIDDTIEELKKLEEIEGIEGIGDLISIFEDLSSALGCGTKLIGSMSVYLKSQADSAELSMEQGKLSIENGLDQLVKGAEALYVGIITMEAALNDVERGIASLDRAVAIFEKQLELGMASAYDVESMKYQRSSVATQLESLKFQILTSKITMEGLCGLEINGNVRLAALTMPTQEELDGVDYDKTVKLATNRNLDVATAKLTYNSDAGTSADRYSWDAAESTFAYNYKIICLTVSDKQRLVEAAEEAAAFQERTFEIEAKKYELGMISYEEYMTASGNLEQAKSDLFTAQLNLFTAYRNYVWARDHGIV